MAVEDMEPNQKRQTPAWKRGYNDANAKKPYKPGLMDHYLYTEGYRSGQYVNNVPFEEVVQHPPAIPQAEGWEDRSEWWKKGWGSVFVNLPQAQFDFPTSDAETEYLQGFESALQWKVGRGELSVNGARAALGLKEVDPTLPGGEVRTVSETGGEKGVKPQRYSLIPVEPLALLAELYGNGAKKYAAHNFRNGYEWSKSYDAAMRHMNAFWAGEDIDPEMGVPHVICAAWHMFTLTTFMIEHPEHDDRYKAEIGTLFENAQKAMAEYKGEQLPPFPTEPSVGPYYPN